MHERMITLVQKHIPNVKEDMKLHIKQLKEKEYYLLFAGKWQTAQKNINLILTLKGLCQLESMRSEIMQITFNCQNSIVFNA